MNKPFTVRLKHCRRCGRAALEFVLVVESRALGCLVALSYVRVVYHFLRVHATRSGLRVDLCARLSRRSFNAAVERRVTIRADRSTELHLLSESSYASGLRVR